MARTYAPTLKFLLKKVCKYIGIHRDAIVNLVGEGNATLVDGVVIACNLLMPVLDTFIPEGS